MTCQIIFIFGMCIDFLVMGIIPFKCHSKNITNDDFYLKDEGRNWGASINVLSLVYSVEYFI